VFAVIALALTAACEQRASLAESTPSHGDTRSETPIVVEAGASALASGPASSAPVPAASSIAADHDAGRAPAWAFDCTETSTPKAGKSIGHTSVVFKVELSSGKKAAWKPNAKKVRGRYKGEVAAFRLAQALGIANVPPACPRTFDTATATKALAANDDATKLFADEVVVERDKIHGAIVPWIDGLTFWPVEKEPLRTETRGWLTAGKDIPTAKIDLARQTSNLVAFDFITGNWDRYSGENVGMDRSGALVLFIDNDAAFMEQPPKEQLARNKRLLEATDRFSRSFIAAIRALDIGRLADVFGEESPGRPLLSSAVLALVARRRDELLAIVDAKIGARGEPETLYFP
jgi:hypothetical protein